MSIADWQESGGAWRDGCIRWVSIAIACLALSVTGLELQALAQSEGDLWLTPVNLSHSGATSDPVIVLVPDGTLRVFWWDQFDGTMVADGSLPAPASEESDASVEADAGWSSPMAATVRISETVTRQGEQVVVLTPIQAVPWIVGDAAGRAHAFWLGEPEEETGNIPLLYSRLSPGSTSWSSPTSLAVTAGSFAVASDSTGRVHLVYVQTEPAQYLPVGLYYRQLAPRGTRWRSPTLVQPSSYVRLLAPDEDDLRLTADNAGNLYVTWDDARQGQVLLAHSTDGGATWGEPEPFHGPGVQPEQDRVIAVPRSGSAVLWEPAGDPQARVVASSAGNALKLAAWDGDEWMATQRLPLHFQNPELGGQVRLNEPYLVLVPSPVEGEDGVETLALLGTDENRDLWITGSGVDAVEQLLAEPAFAQDQTEPPAPVNLSQSGVASDAVIVAGSDSALRAFWWDRFDGLTLADGAVQASSVLSGTEEIPTIREVWSEPRAVPILLPETGPVGGEEGVIWTPIEAMPQVVADAAGGIHAFWLVEPDELAAAGEELAARPLMHSRLEADETAWSSPTLLAEPVAGFDVATDPSGTLHLAYVDTLHTAFSPAGVYYRRLEQGGTGWTAPTTLQQSRYFRPLTPETAHVRLAADGEGDVYVTWDDPRQEQILLAYSSDGGTSWVGPTTFGSPEEHLQRGRLVPVPGGETLLLWERAGLGGPCNLVQAAVEEVLGGATDAGQPVLEGLMACPEGEEYLPLAEGQVLMVAGIGSEALTVAVWDSSTASGAGGGQWSEPSRLSFGFEDPDMGRQAYLGGLRAVPVQPPPGAAGGSAGWALIAVGIDQEGDVWATSSQMGDLEMVFAPPPPWSAPDSVSRGEAFPDLPAMAADTGGGLHALWSEAPALGEEGTGLLYARRDGAVEPGSTEQGWSQPASVLESPAGSAREPALVAVGDRLHAVWSGGENGEVLYSRVFAHDAYAAVGWSEPVPLPAPGEVGGCPDIAAGSDGSLHVVYAVPLNEGRGIYYTRSADGGETWSPARQVFDAAAAGWLMADRPSLAVDPQGLLHIAWVRRGLPGSGPPQGVYYAGSFDGGGTWSEPFEVAAGTHAWPQVASGRAGQVHLAWNETGGQPAWWHRWSLDGGQTWAQPERVPGFGEVSAPATLLAEDSGALHLLGLSSDGGEEPALWLSTWDGQRWGAPEASGLEVGAVDAGLAASLQPTQGRLEALFRAEGESEERAAVQPQLWHTGRQLPAVAVTPLPAVASLLTATPVPTPEPTATPRPTVSFGAAPPATTASSLPIPVPVLLAGGLAALIVAGVLAGRFLWAGRR